MLQRFHPRRPSRRAYSWALIALLALVAPAGPSLLAGTARGEDKRETAVEQPLFVISIASVDRVLADIDYFFETVDRREFSTVVRGFLAVIGDLKGIDRTRPLGMLGYIDPGVAPQPVAIGFVPLTSIDELAESLTRGPVKLTKVEGGADRYELVGSGQTIQVAVQGDYAFLAKNATSLDRRFPDPARLAKPLASRYDAAASLNLAEMPAGMKHLILDYARAKSEADLRRHPGETDAHFGGRKAGADAVLALYEQLVDDGRAVTLGWNVAHDRRLAELELDVTAARGSALAKRLAGLGDRSAQFERLPSDKSPLALSVSWILSGACRKLLRTEVLDASRRAALSTAEREKWSAAGREFLVQAYRSVSATVSAGHVDLAARVVGESPGPFVLLGGANIDESEKLAGDLARMLTELRNDPGIESVQTGVVRHRGIVLHRIVPKVVSRLEERLYGKRPALYVGVGQGAVWFAFGGERALPDLQAAMDRAAGGSGQETQASDGVPLQLSVQMSPWLAMLSDEDKSRRLAKYAVEAFSKGGDTLRVEVRPVENGVRLRLEAGEGFIRLAALSLVRRIEGE